MVSRSYNTSYMNFSHRDTDVDEALSRFERAIEALPQI
jgi:hypothetical protein